MSKACHSFPVVAMRLNIRASQPRDSETTNHLRMFPCHAVDCVVSMEMHARRAGMNEWAEEHGWAENVDQLNWGAEDGDMYGGYGDQPGDYGSGYYDGYYDSHQLDCYYPYADGECEGEVLLAPPPPPPLPTHPQGHALVPLHPSQHMRTCYSTASTCHNGSYSQ